MSRGVVEMAGGVVRGLLYRLGVPVAALAAGVVGAFPIFALGLFVPGEVVLPLTMGFSALLAALGAAWTGNLLSPDGTGSRLLSIVGASEAAAALLTLLLFALTFGLDVRWPFPGFPLLLSVLALAVVASVATWRFRSRVPTPGRDAVLTLALMGLALLIVVGTVFATCSLVPCVP